MSINTALLALRDCIAVEQSLPRESRHASNSAFDSVIAEAERIEAAKPRINEALVYFHDGHLDQATASIDLALRELEG